MVRIGPACCFRLTRRGVFHPLVWGNRDLGHPQSITAAKDGSIYFAAASSDSGEHSLTIYHVTFTAPKITAQPAPKISALAGTTASLAVKANGGGCQWTRNGEPLADGEAVAGANGSVLTLGPLTAAEAGSYAVIVSGVTGSATSAASVLTVKPDIAAPGVAIATVTTAGATGKATDNAFVTGVEYWITNFNSAPLLHGSAALGGGTAVRAWSIPVMAAPGSNVLVVRATDFSGNVSGPASRLFFVTMAAPVTIAKSGAPADGTLIAGPANQALLNIGQAYTLTVKPDANSWFVNWTGNGAFHPQGATTNPTLRFLMEPNTAITANFSSNLFHGMAGTYNGLFAEDAVRAESAGMVNNLVVDGAGKFSGKLPLAGGTYAMAGVFDNMGRANNVLARPAAGPSRLIASLLLRFDSNPRQISGTVSNAGAGWTANLAAAISATAPSLPGQFTALLLTNGTALPGEWLFAGDE